MKYIVFIYIIWLIVLITGLVYWIPKYVEKEYRDITIHFTLIGFTFISITTRFIEHILNGDVNRVHIGLYLLSIAVLLTAVTGVYYWVPKYFPKGIPDPITGDTDSKYTNVALLATFTMTLLLINLYEQEYSEGLYKSGEVISNLVNYGGKRKK